MYIHVSVPFQKPVNERIPDKYFNSRLYYTTVAGALIIQKNKKYL